MDMKTARNLNILAGAWLFLSTLVWLRTCLQWTNTLVMGIVIMVVSAFSSDLPNLRYLNALAGVWLMVSSALYSRPFSSGMRWSNFVVGFVVAVLSLVGRPTRRATQIWPV